MRLRRVDDSIRGPSAFVLALNYSFVLHEPVSSQAVSELVAQQQRRRVERSRQVPPASVLGLIDFASCRPDVVLTALVGAPLVLQDLVGRLEPPPAVVTIEAATSETKTREFFRAPASLQLPTAAAERLVVAAVVARPGGSSFQLAMSGPYRWPADENRALRGLEDVIRSYIDQWLPGRALWTEPAEQLLPEVLTESRSSSDNPG